MKKISRYVALALAVVSMAACSESYTDWAQPSTPAEEGAITIPGLTASDASAINLGTVAEGTDSVCTFNLSEVSLPEGFALGHARVELTAVNATTPTTTTLEAQVNGNVLADDLQNLVVTAFGKRPTARQLTAHVYLDAVRNGEAVLIDAGTVTVTVTPQASYISAHYYLIGAPSQWEPTCTTMPFTHSDKDVYDDPEFTVVFPVEDGEIWFAVADDSTVLKNDWDYVYGCMEGNGNNGMTGTLDRRRSLSDDGSWKITVNGDAKFVKMTINMLDYSYKLEKLNFQEYLYMAGNANGWQQVDPVSSPSFDGKYTGFMYLDGGGFKFCTQQNWSGTNYGENFSTDGGAGNMPLPDGYSEGYYKVDVDLTSNSLSLTAINTIGVIGDATADGWNSSTPLTFNKSERCWEGDVTFTDGTFKFRANDGWDINWGGDMQNLSFGGDNIPVTAGTYHVALYPNCPGKATCTLTKK